MFSFVVGMEIDQRLLYLVGGVGLGVGITLACTPKSRQVNVGTIGERIPSLAKQGLPIYLDWNATTPVFPEVTEAMMPYTGMHFGNPSSDSPFSQTCAKAVVDARSAVATMIGCKPDEVVFTSCGTESDNTAIHLAIKAHAMVSTQTHKPHVVTTNIEHPAIEQCLADLESTGTIEVTRVSVNHDGTVNVDDIVNAIKPTTALVTVMHSNNELGSIFPIAEIGVECRKRGVLFHTDAAQSCGKVELRVGHLGVDMMTVVGHKFGAPKGIAALFVRTGCLEQESKRSTPPKFGKNGGLLVGGGQESGRRGGTENVLLITALGAACAVVTRELKTTHEHMSMLRERLLRKLKTSHVDSIVNGPVDQHCRLPNTLSISFQHVESSSLLHNVRSQVAASAGSACHTGGGISAVLQAVNVSKAHVGGTLRLSVGRHTTLQDVDDAATIILNQINRLVPRTQ